MRIDLAVRIFVFTILLSGPTVFGVRAETRGALSLEVRTDSGEKKLLTLYERSHALVIGIDRYQKPGWKPLSHAVRDARAVKAGLEQHGFQVTLLENLNGVDLDREIKQFFIRVGAEPNARLLFWFAGHGYSMRPELFDSEAYLVPADAPGAEQETEFRFAAMPLRRFGDYLRAAKSKHILAVFDSCFSGSILTSIRSSEPVPSGITQLIERPVRRLIAAGAHGQTVQDDGLFRSLFLGAISGEAKYADGDMNHYITGSELSTFLENEVARQTGGRQTPKSGKLPVRGQIVDGDFVFRIPPRTKTANTVAATPATAATSGSTTKSAATGDGPVSSAIKSDKPSVTNTDRAGSERTLGSISTQCIKNDRHPRAERIAREIVEQITEPGKKLEHSWQFKNAFEQLAKDGMPRDVRKIEHTKGQIHLTYAWQNGEISLTPVFDKAPKSPTENMILLQGGWLQDNTFGCVEFRFNRITETGDGQWWPADSRNRSSGVLASLRRNSPAITSTLKVLSGK